MSSSLLIKKRELETFNDSWKGGININNFNDKYSYYYSILSNNNTLSYLNTHYSKLLSNVTEFIDKYKRFIKLNMEQHLPEKGLGDIIVNYILQ
jgi:hypothetical protein